MVDGELGRNGENAHAPVVVVCSTPLGTATTLCPRTEANSARAKGFSIDLAIQRLAPTAMVRDATFRIANHNICM